MKMLARLILLTLLVTLASCKKSGVTGNENTADANVTAATGDTASTPPFATKEPERYQAIRVITTSAAGTNGAAEPVSRTLIARDGERRREDYEAGAGEKISYLQLPEGSYVLLPDKKLYAELKPEGEGGGSSKASERATSIAPDFSPDRLLNEVRPESRYEKLGPETLNGRAVQKYRVTVLGKTGTSRAVTTESIVWVDEQLGMPVRTETTSTGGAATGAKVVTELRDIKETIDAGLLELPQGYRKVEARELFAQVNGADSSGAGRP
jgi:outer membrane lipoprotein-sorting protein